MLHVVAESLFLSFCVWVCLLCLTLLYWKFSHPWNKQIINLSPYLMWKSHHKIPGCFVEAAWPSDLGRWIWNLEAPPPSNPSPHRYLDLFSVFLSSIPRRYCVKSQLVSLPSLGFLNSLCSIYLNKVHCVLFFFLVLISIPLCLPLNMSKFYHPKINVTLIFLVYFFTETKLWHISFQLCKQYNLVLNPFILGMQVFHLFLPALASNCVKNWLQFQNQFQNCFKQHCWLFLFKKGQRCYQSTPLLFPLHYS